MKTHPLNVSYLVSGLVYLGSSGSWALLEAGFRVTTAVDAADARAKLASIAFDLLVLDIMMPGETGLQLTETLRRDNAVPILLLTAMNETENRIAGFECGADDYLPKPFEPRELVLRINAILRRVPPPPTARCVRGPDRGGWRGPSRARRPWHAPAYGRR